MNNRIILFNVTYYAIILFLYYQTQQDPSSSLGIGMMAMVFITVAFIILLILLYKKVLPVKTVWDKIGIFMATPIPLIVVVLIITRSIGALD